MCSSLCIVFFFCSYNFKSVYSYSRTLSFKQCKSKKKLSQTQKVKWKVDKHFAVCWVNVLCDTLRLRAGRMYVCSVLFNKNVYTCVYRAVSDYDQKRSFTGALDKMYLFLNDWLILAIYCYLYFLHWKICLNIRLQTFLYNCTTLRL